MSKLERAINDLVIGNRILAHENVVDAYGHISIRHPDRPDRFLLSRSRSPELVEPGDIMEFTLDGEVVGSDKRPPYLERFIHAGVYEKRPDLMSVVHSHAEGVLPFAITQTKLVPVIHSASEIGLDIPVWDIAEKFGDTSLLVTNAAQGRDLAARIGANSVTLMRGHGFVAGGQTLLQTLRMSVALPKNARVFLEAMRLGPVKPLSAGEIKSRQGVMGVAETPATLRAWEYWACRCGCGHLLPGGGPQRG
ncbi:MAG: class II aldolase/adducin family protein [Xanthobacteraceae bacterium]